jgi:hypothetical protein
MNGRVENKISKNIIKDDGRQRSYNYTNRDETSKTNQRTSTEKPEQRFKQSVVNAYDVQIKGQQQQQLCRVDVEYMFESINR